MIIQLSESQKEVVDHNEGALLVVAGPGSGKTRVITERIKRLLSERHGHFHVLALTFTNKAANEMKERLADTPKIGERAFIGTIHSFCMEVLVQRGSSVGISELPQVLDVEADRKAILADAVNNDPDLRHRLKSAGDLGAQNKLLTSWMNKIKKFKGKLLPPSAVLDYDDRTMYEAYQATMKADGAIDFDDLLLLTYTLLTEKPKVANFFQRLYEYICVDEGQDLNYAQYHILCALAGDNHKNIMLVGDPKQAIFGFSDADPKFLKDFRDKFDAKVIKLKENYRSSKKVVQVAKALKPQYDVVGVLPIEGEVVVQAAEDETAEADFVIAKIQELMKHGHPDVEGTIALNNCGVLSRTRYGLFRLEERLNSMNWKYYKQWSSRQDNASTLFADFESCLRALANPRNHLHRKQLADRWEVDYSLLPTSTEVSGEEIIGNLAKAASSGSALICLDAVLQLKIGQGRLSFSEAFRVMKSYADTRDAEEKRAVYEDIDVFTSEWDSYVRSSTGGEQNLKSFMMHAALGISQPMKQEGLALITIHSAKGLEFDVVFVIGMAERTFPDYRSLSSNAALEEERRNAFVAVSRSKRLLYLTYPKTKEMPWGDIMIQQPSRFLRDMNLI